MKKFDATSTGPDVFHVSAGETIQVPLMYINDEFCYGVNEELNCQVVMCLFTLIIIDEFRSCTSVISAVTDSTKRSSVTLSYVYFIL